MAAKQEGNIYFIFLAFVSVMDELKLRKERNLFFVLRRRMGNDMICLSMRVCGPVASYTANIHTFYNVTPDPKTFSAGIYQSAHHSVFSILVTA